MRLFVTGAAGFIGSNYLRYVLDHSDDSVVVRQVRVPVVEQWRQSMPSFSRP